MKRILICGATPFLNNNQSRFLKSYFCNYDSSLVYQIYSSNVVPEPGCAKSHYRITDKEVLKAFLRFKKAEGKFFSETQLFGGTQQTIPSINKNRLLIKLIRFVIWRERVWKSKNLEKWVDDFKPEAVFLTFHEDLYMINIATFFAAKYQIPLLISINDDYIFSSHFSLNPLYIVLWKIYTKKVKNLLLNKNSHLFYISEAMKRKYDKEFQKNGVVIHVSTNNKFTKFQVPEKIKSLICFGDLSLGRLDALIAISNVIKKVDPTCYISVFSGTHIPKQIDNHSENIIFHKPISYDELSKKICDSDAILIVEELHKKSNINKVKYSLTTKLADSLCSGKPIFIVGNSCAGTVDYASKNELGYVITEKDNLEDKINIDKILQFDWCKVQINAQSTIDSEFNSYKNSEKFIDYIENKL